MKCCSAESHLAQESANWPNRCTLAFVPPCVQLSSSTSILQLHPTTTSTVRIVDRHSSKGCNQTAYYNNDIWSSNFFPKQTLQEVFVTKDFNFTTTAFAAGIGVQNQKAAVHYWRKLSNTRRCLPRVTRHKTKVFINIFARLPMASDSCLWEKCSFSSGSCI